MFNGLQIFDKKTGGGAAKLANKSAIKNENISIEELWEELHKPIIRQFKKREIYSSFIGNIWIADLAGMQLISTFNKGIRFLSCLYIFNKYVLVIPLKDKKGITITNVFEKVLDESNRKPNKTWVDKASEF